MWKGLTFSQLKMIILKRWTVISKYVILTYLVVCIGYMIWIPLWLCSLEMIRQRNVSYFLKCGVECGCCSFQNGLFQSHPCNCEDYCICSRGLMDTRTGKRALCNLTPFFPPFLRSSLPTLLWLLGWAFTKGLSNLNFKVSNRTFEFATEFH